MKEKYKVSEICIYIGYVKENEYLYTNLKKNGYKLIFKNTKQFGKGRTQIKGNIDVDPTVDAIRKVNKYLKGVFVSADGDFIALYNYLVEECGKELIILIPNMYKYSSFLLKYRKNLRFLNDLEEKLKV